MGKYVLLDDNESAAPVSQSNKFELLPTTSHDSMAGSVMIGSDPSKSAGYGAALGSGFIDNPGAKAAYFAAKRFPNLPPDQALARYGVGGDGQVFYKADDGNLYYEVPANDWSVSGAIKRALGGAGDVVAAAPGAATGIATAPLWLTGPGGAGASVALTGAAGAAGEAGRQTIGNLIAVDKISGRDIVRAAAIEATSQAAGGALTSYVGRRAAKDVSRINPAQVNTLQTKANAVGVDLTPAQLTDLPSLKNQQTLLSELDSSADTMAAFYGKQGAQSDAAVTKYLQGLSANDSLELAGARTKEAAFDAIKAAAKKRADAAGPLYKMAFDNAVGLNPAAVPRAQALMARMPRDVVKEAMEIARIEGIDLGNPKDSFRGMHYLKLALDRKINAGPWEGVSGAKKNAMLGLKDELLTALDDISPKDVGGRSLYQLARQVYAHNSPIVESTKDGLVGAIAGLKDDNARNAVKMLLDPSRSGPIAMRKAKTAIENVDPEAWQQVKRGFLEDIWQDVSTKFASGSALSPGAKFSARLRGNSKQWEMLKEALAPNELRALGDLLDVLEATGRGLSRNSATVQKGETLRNMTRQAGGVTGDILGVANIPLKAAVTGRISDFYREAMLGNHAAKLAEIITSPDGMKKLRDLRKVSPKETRFYTGFAQLFGLYGNAKMSGDSDFEPSMPTQ